MSIPSMLNMILSLEQVGQDADAYIILPSVASTIRKNDNASVDFPGGEARFSWLILM